MLILLYTIMTIFIIVCLFMILLVLIQKGRGGGLASAFGGSGGNTAFGSKTGDVLTWATSVVFGIFLVLAIILNLLANSYHNKRMGPAPTAQVVNPQGVPTGDTAPPLPTTIPSTVPASPQP